VPAAASPGALVAWWDGERLRLGVLASEEKQRSRIVVEGGREERIPAGRFAYVVEPNGARPGPTFEGRVAAGQRVVEAAARLAKRAEGVDVLSLWEIALSSAEPLEEASLAELALGDRSEEARAALAIAFVRDGVRFSRRAGRWEPRKRDEVARILEGRRIAEQRRREREAGLAALARAFETGTAFAGGVSQAERRYLDSLEKLAVFDQETPESDRALALEAIAACRIRYDRPNEAAFRILRRLGRFSSDDENLEVLRHGLRTDFPGEVEEAAREAAQRGFSREGRTDLSGLAVFTVDGPDTRELDDALSIEARPGGGLRLGIHIADPAAFTSPDDPLDREAFARAVSHYLPERRLPMFPPAISEQAASLVPGQLRPALSVLVELAPSGRVDSYELRRTIVRSRSRLDYDAVDRTLRSGEGPFGFELRRLAELAEALEQRRVAAGAVVVRMPEVEVRVEEGTIRLERRDPASPAQRIVSEAMILAGRLAAEFARERGIPILYRRQDPPDRPLPAPASGEEEILFARRVRRLLKRAETSLLPGPHFALGLSAYAQVTSPLRRYQDLATHRQIGAVLLGLDPPYDAEAMQRIAATTERAEAEGREAERASERYWMLRWYEGKVGEAVRAIVVETSPRPVVLLEDTLLEEPVPSLGGVERGDRIELEIVRVVPRADLLVLRAR